MPIFPGLTLGQWWPQSIGRSVPLFYFRICTGSYSGTSGEGFDLADREAAWVEMTRVCGELVAGIARKLKQQSEWRMELLDESQKPVFRIRVMAETVDQPAVASDAVNHPACNT